MLLNRGWLPPFPIFRSSAREKDETIANHMYRALGRCGAGEDKAREVLVKHASAGKRAAMTVRTSAE